MNGMCMLPVTRRGTMVVGGSGCGEKGDNADNNSCSSCGSTGDGGCNNESASGVCTPRSGFRNNINSADDDISGSNANPRKTLTVEPRQSRAQSMRKLQKCLSTTTNHYEVDPSSLNNFPTASLFSSHRSTEMRSYTPIGPQTLNYQNILSNTRQYNSFGSIIKRIIIFMQLLYKLCRPSIFFCVTEWDNSILLWLLFSSFRCWFDFIVNRAILLW